MILKFILEELAVKIWTRLNWLRIEFNAEVLETQWWTFCFCKRNFLTSRITVNYWSNNVIMVHLPCIMHSSLLHLQLVIPSCFRAYILHLINVLGILVVPFLVHNLSICFCSYLLYIKDF
jgi:hypothetical protein